MTPTPRSAEEWARQVADRGLGWQLKMSEIAKLMAEVQADALRAAAAVCRERLKHFVYEDDNAGRANGAGICARAIESMIPSTTQKETTT